MQAIDIDELVRNSKQGTEEQVREAVETIRQVEKLGGKRSQYNLASPFSRSRPSTVSHKTPR
jgi:predicted RNA-binding protein associated with RNAse of E/G family